MKRRVLSLITVLALCLTLLPTALAADPTEVASGNCGVVDENGVIGDNLTWTLDDAGLLTIRGEGEMGVWKYANSAPWYPHAEKITKAVIENGVTSLSRSMFYPYLESYSNLTSIEIPASVTSFDPRAIGYCNSLTEITVSEGNENYCSEGGVVFNKAKTTLVRCPTGLTACTIPDSVTTIGDYAFTSNRKLATITIPENVTNLGEGAFNYNEALTSVTFLGSMTEIGTKAFNYCNKLEHLKLPKGLERIGDHAFATGVKLTSIEIPDTITYIGPSAFTNCGFINLTIPGTVKTIDESAFYYCHSMTSLEIQNGVESIGKQAFGRSEALPSVTIPGSVKSIGEEAFFTATS